jgi:hypothetical protein
MNANLINIDWVNQFSAVQQFAAGLIIGFTVISIDWLRKR